MDKNMPEYDDLADEAEEGEPDTGGHPEGCNTTTCVYNILLWWQYIRGWHSLSRLVEKINN